jgi:hypothetical protein
MNEFEIRGYEGDVEVLEQFYDLISGRSTRIGFNASNCKSFESLFEILENEKILDGIIAFRTGNKITIDNCISILRDKVRNNCDFEAELNYISSHFWEFHSADLEELKQINLEVLDRILNSPNLLIRNEDSLIDFISSLGEEYSVLYEYVQFEFLTETGFRKFLSSVDLEDINSSLWGSFCRRFLSDASNHALPNKRFSGLSSLRYHLGRKWNGIIDHLTKKCGGNVHEKGVVNITASRPGGVNDCSRVVNYGAVDGFWHSLDVPDSWICFDFKEKSVSLQHYTVKSESIMGYFCVQWELEGSNDGKTWRSLDSRNTTDLYDKATKTYRCSDSVANEFFSFIRMRQTERNSRGDNRFPLCNLEFFGILKGDI